MSKSTRSLRLSPNGKQQVKEALTNKAWGSAELAEVEVSEPTAKNFLAGKPVDHRNFSQFCSALELPWKTVVDLSENSSGSNRPLFSQSLSETEEIERLEEEVRSRSCEKILYQHGTIRLLNQTEIEVDQLYVDVWLLDRSPRTFATLSKSFDLRNNRLGLGDRIRRNDGMAVANRRNRLLILGKPGAGKTTFLKHLAVDCCNGKFQPNLIPVLIELRRIQSTG